jgi:hypothetical protein
VPVETLETWKLLVVREHGLLSGVEQLAPADENGKYEGGERWCGGRGGKKRRREREGKEEIVPCHPTVQVQPPIPFMPALHIPFTQGGH